MESLFLYAADDDEQVLALCKRGALANVKGRLSHAPIEMPSLAIKKCFQTLFHPGKADLALARFL